MPKRASLGGGPSTSGDRFARTRALRDRAGSCNGCAVAWHIIETHITIGTPVLHSTVSPALPNPDRARAAVQVRLEQILRNHPEDREAREAVGAWAAGQDEVYIGTHTWSVIEAVLSPQIATHTYLKGLAAAFTDGVGMDLAIADPTFET